MSVTGAQRPDFVNLSGAGDPVSWHPRAISRATKTDVGEKLQNRLSVLLDLRARMSHPLRPV